MSLKSRLIYGKKRFSCPQTASETIPDRQSLHKIFIFLQVPHREEGKGKEDEADKEEYFPIFVATVSSQTG